MRRASRWILRPGAAERVSTHHRRVYRRMPPGGCKRRGSHMTLIVTILTIALLGLVGVVAMAEGLILFYQQQRKGSRPARSDGKVLEVTLPVVGSLSTTNAAIGLIALGFVCLVSATQLIQRQQELETTQRKLEQFELAGAVTSDESLSVSNSGVRLVRIVGQFLVSDDGQYGGTVTPDSERWALLVQSPGRMRGMALQSLETLPRTSPINLDEPLDLDGLLGPVVTSEKPPPIARPEVASKFPKLQNSGGV